jgi:cytochrome P450
VAWGLKHHECFSSKSPDNLAVDPLLLAADPPQHSRMRQALAPLVAQFDSSRIADICRAWISPFISRVKQGHSPFDVVADLADPLPRHVVAEMLGLAPAESRELESLWTPTNEIPNPETTDLTGDLLARILERIQSQGCPGICSALLQATGPARLAFEEMAGLIKLLHLAGTTTTNHLISSAVLYLLKHPDLAGQFRRDSKLLPAFIDEILRLESPAHYVMRMVVKETNLAGEIIPEGANVRLYLGAANRDPAKFDAPDQLRLDRKFRGHLAFGAGSHYCPGAAISRTVARVVIEHWLAELSEARCLLPLDAIPYHSLPYLRAIRELPVSIET